MDTEAPSMFERSPRSRRLLASLEASLAAACEGSDMPNAGEAELHLPTAHRWNRKMPAWTHTTTCSCGHCYAERTS